jgi:putative ABC transport system substrate-binding protein
MRRRVLFAFFGGAVLATYPHLARAQQSGELPRLGFLGVGTPSAEAYRVEALRAGLRELGYIEGKNLIIEFRWADGPEQLQAAATDLVRIKVDVIFATSSTEVERARRVTNTIPIVFATHADPVGVGHVESLAQPGGNITGLADIQTEITAKRLELLKETLPQATRFGVLLTPAAPSYRPFLEAAEAASPKLGIQLVKTNVRTVEDLDAAFTTMEQGHADAVVVHAATLSRVHRTRLADLALKHRLPSMFGLELNVEAGGLMSYAPDHLDLIRRAAIYIDKILKGAKPSDLPVEQASKYQLVINLKTAAALGLTIPPAILARADEVIE